MKALGIAAWLWCLTSFGQGTVLYLNQSTSLVYTNALAIGGGRGPTSTNLGGFQFALFTAPSTVTSVSVPDLLSQAWTFTGLYATNFAAVTGGRFWGGLGVATLTGWPPGQTNSFTIAGWSTDMGHSWPEVAQQLGGGALSPEGLYVGPNFLGGGFFGLSGVGFGAAGGGETGLPAFGIFGLPNGQGTPLSAGFDLYLTQNGLIPEPSAVALLILGTTCVLRRRNRNSTPEPKECT